MLSLIVATLLIAAAVAPVAGMVVLLQRWMEGVDGSGIKD